MEINLVKTKYGLIPAMDDDNMAVSTLQIGEVYNFKVKLFRNYQFHKKFFAMLTLCFENQDQYNNFDHFRKIITMRAGYFETVITDKSVVYLPKSIAFDKMEEEEFTKLYDKALDECINIVPFDKGEIQAQLAEFG